MLKWSELWLPSQVSWVQRRYRLICSRFIWVYICSILYLSFLSVISALVWQMALNRNVRILFVYTDVLDGRKFCHEAWLLPRDSDDQPTRAYFSCQTCGNFCRSRVRLSTTKPLQHHAINRLEQTQKSNIIIFFILYYLFIIFIIFYPFLYFWYE